MQFRSTIVLALVAVMLFGFFAEIHGNYIQRGTFGRKFGSSSSSNHEWGSSFKVGPGGRTEDGFERGGSKSDKYDNTEIEGNFGSPRRYY